MFILMIEKDNEICLCVMMMISQGACKRGQCRLSLAVGQCLTMLFICHCPNAGSCILSVFTDNL